MHPRIRKLIGTLVLLALVIVWSLLAMALAQFVLVRTSGVLDFAYYVMAGLGWVPFAMMVVSWMSRGEQPRPADEITTAGRANSARRDRPSAR